jgi:deoxycytidine triphosphate deaminase
MLLSHTELKELVKRRVITNVTDDMINSASIDITLGSRVIVEGKPNAGDSLMILRDKPSLHGYTIDINEDGLTLEPGDFALACSQQAFNLPNDISAEYKLKSSMARIGLEHFNAGWCDAGWNGSVLTMELINLTKHHKIRLFPGDKIGQIVFFRHVEVPEEASYAKRGRYNNDKTVSGAKA